MESLSVEKRKLIENIAKDSMDSQIQVAPGSLKGDGYLGVIYTVTIKSKQDEIIQNLILKSAQDSDQFRKQTPVHLVYAREVFLYKIIFPQFIQIEEKHNLNGPLKRAQFFGAILEEPHESLLLGNIRDYGYQLWDRRLCMNREHLELVFRTYAQFHAMSLVLKTEKPELFKEYAKELFNVFHVKRSDLDGAERMRKMMENTMQSIQEVLTETIAENDIHKLTCGLIELIEEMGVEPDPDSPNSIILHGDCWCNNMMFKYDQMNNGKPEKVCFLDFQISRLADPIQDLIYFFYTNCSRSDMDNLNAFLTIYAQTMQTVLDQCKCVKFKAPSVAELEKGFRKYSRYGLFLASMVLKIVISEPDEALNLSQLADEGKDIFDAFGNYKSVNVQQYHKRIRDCVDFILKRRFVPEICSCSKSN